MKRAIFTTIVLGIFAVAMPVTVLAEIDGVGDFIASDSPAASESTYMSDAGAWPASGPVETGAVPGMSDKSDRSLIDTHHDPFSPNLREVDRSTGG